MTEHLQFILPYIRPVNQTNDRGNLANVNDEESLCDSETNTDARVENSVNTTTLRNGSNSNQNAPESSCSEGFHNNVNETSTIRKRKRTHTDLDNAFIAYLRSKKTSIDRIEGKKNDPVPECSPMQHFLMSLLPEFDSMSEDQIRSFKIKVLTIIDEIKNSAHASTAAQLGGNFQSPSASYYSSGTHTPSDSFSLINYSPNPCPQSNEIMGSGTFEIDG